MYERREVVPAYLYKKVALPCNWILGAARNPSIVSFERRMGCPKLFELRMKLTSYAMLFGGIRAARNSSLVYKRKPHACIILCHQYALPP